MATALIYKITVTQAIWLSDQGTYFSLSPWGESTAEIQGYDDGGHEYELPEGFHVAESNSGGLYLYDKSGAYWPLGTYGSTPKVGARLLRRVRQSSEV